MIHSPHRCLRWCQWCSATTGTQQSRIASHISFPHIPRNSAKMEFSQTRGLWCLSCHNKIELLSPGILHHHAQWQKTFVELFQWQKCKHQGKSMVTRACYVQHHIQMDITSMKQGNRLSIPISWGFKQSSSYQHPHQYSSWIHNKGPAAHTHSKTKTSMDAMPPDILSSSQQDTAKLNTPWPLMEDCKESLIQIKKTDPFCKHISKQLLNGKAPHHEADSFTHINGLFYKHAMDVTQKFLVLVTPKSWCFTVCIKANDELGQ